ncbi:MAG TPA: hypothetical protein VK501_06785 [Baekduia sp.]|uniref:hypothetical protein n=1 Tax=Baekduia sp. TaxID=2600305 RepID=UPI002CAD2127|nr:hypothetical protein [Baekduia sp.]HMJ33605.1 hypothetical protein [Baekduia sp.]
MRGTSGQASVELLGMVPLAVIVALGAGQLLAAGVARAAADGAAQAAAMALVQGGDPARAARAAAPDWAHARLSVHVSGRHVRVRIAPPGLLPGTADLLAAGAEADAGPGS